MRKEIKCPSGAKLEILNCPFHDALALQKAILKEWKGVDFNPEEAFRSMKDFLCTMFSSPEVQSALDMCMKQVLYNGLKIDKDTFEPIEARDDYITVCLEVAKENLLPFMKSLYAEFRVILAKIKSIPA